MSQVTMDDLVWLKSYVDHLYYRYTKLAKRGKSEQLILDTKEKHERLLRIYNQLMIEARR